MPRHLVSTFLLFVCLASLNCQSYTTSLETSSGRVDEAAAISTLRAIAQAQTAYSISNAGDYGSFEQLAAGGFLDSRFNRSKPKIYGYVLTMKASSKSTGADESSYSCNADPDPTANRSGRHFYIDSDSTGVRVNAAQPASASDDILQP